MDARKADDLEAALVGVESAVTLVFFTQTFGCEACLPARQVVDRLASFSDQISVEEFNLVLDKAEVESYGIRRAPAIVVVGDLETIREQLRARVLVAWRKGPVIIQSSNDWSCLRERTRRM